MKKHFKIIFILALAFALILSFTGCKLLDALNPDSGDNGDVSTEGGKDNANNKDDSSNKNPKPDENGGSSGSGGVSDDDGENSSDSGNSGSGDNSGVTEDDDGNDNNNDNSNNNDNNDSSDDTDNTEPPEEESIYLEDTDIPHFDYSDKGSSKYNSKLFYANDYDIGLGDPTVYYREEADGGWFYVTGTTSGKYFELWRTKNFTTWGYLGKIYTPPEDFFGVENLWAPQISYDADADWSYYLGSENEGGKGLYVLAFSAKDSSGMFRLAIAFSKEITGPYTHFSGTNANGDQIDASTTCFEIEKLKGLGLYADHSYGDLYKDRRGFIDASPYIDPVSGDKYLYMVRNRTADKSNDAWGVKMKDWVSPDYSTTTPLSAYGYTTIDKTEALNFTTTNKIDEGPFLYYKDKTDDGIDNGKYYLTLSIGDTNDKLYSVIQAIGDSPLGPFTKLQPDDGGFVITPGELWDIHSSGHHCFFEADGELFIGYHTYTINSDTTYIRRYFGMAEVRWVYNDNGDYIMRANGPSKDIQPLPKASSEYENLIDGATFTIESDGSVGNAKTLTDGLITLRENDGSSEFEFTERTVLSFEFDDYVTARAILIYNSYDYVHSFDNIERIEVTYRKAIAGKYYYGTAYIEDIGFNFDDHLIPTSYLLAKGETKVNQLRPGGAAIAEFAKLEINSIKITVNPTDRAESCRISEIMLLGNHEGVYSVFGTSKEKPFLPYNEMKIDTTPGVGDELIKIDGTLSEELRDLCTSVHIQGTEVDKTTGEAVDVEKYGERSADVYTYIGDKYVYFAFEVKDKNLFYHSSKPQGRSTAVELYICNKDQTDLAEGCYSIRINPIADGELRLGTYVPNAQGNEWTATALPGMISANVRVDGEIITSAPSEDFDRNNNTGYVIEIAIDKSLIGLDADSFKFTAAFVQMKEYDEARMENSFIEGTKYITVSTWKTVSNEGIIEE
ncbi:MAG: hypothetical protein IJD79_01700 [Clostridia bacterium]|nr:hypothetical protein [Clostridia bacterium]